MNNKIRGILIVVTVIIFIIFVIAEVVISYFSTFGFHGLGDEKGDWGTFGDFIGGVLNPLLSLCGFIALLWTLLEQREQLNRTDKAQARQAFEGAFFELLKMHNEALASLDDAKIKHINEQIFSTCRSDYQDISNHSEHALNMIQNMAKRKLQENNHVYGHYFQILYQLLKFIAINSNNGITEMFNADDIEKDDVNAGEKMYSNIVRALLTNDVMKLLAITINCFSEKNGEDNYWKYKLLIERYELFQHASFSDDNGTHRYLQCAEKFYTPKAFGK